MKGHLKTVGVAGIRKQFAGGVRAVGQALFQVGRVAADACCNHGASGHRSAQHHAGLDGVDVDGLVDGLAHALVFERVFAFDAAVGQLVALLVKAQKDHA